MRAVWWAVSSFVGLQTPISSLNAGATLIIKLKSTQPGKRAATVGWTFLRLAPLVREPRDGIVLSMFQRPTDLKLRKCRPADIFVCADVEVCQT